MYRRSTKRIFDLVLVIPALIVLAPIFAILAVLVRLKLGSPILFCQERPGRYGKPFIMFKLRTMTDARDAQGHLLPDGERMTTFGRFLRSTSLDELPELFNVLRGEMSLVGPRPLLLRYLKRYTPQQMRRHEALPGITGWAQVNGRSALGWEQRFALDVWYVDHTSFWLDLCIIALTLKKVIARDDVGTNTFDEVDFWGTEGPPPTGPQAYPADRD